MPHEGCYQAFYTATRSSLWIDAGTQSCQSWGFPYTSWRGYLLKSHQFWALGSRLNVSIIDFERSQFVSNILWIQKLQKVPPGSANFHHYWLHFKFEHPTKFLHKRSKEDVLVSGLTFEGGAYYILIKICKKNVIQTYWFFSYQFVYVRKNIFHWLGDFLFADSPFQFKICVSLSAFLDFEALFIRVYSLECSKFWKNLDGGVAIDEFSNIKCPNYFLPRFY